MQVEQVGFMLKAHGFFSINPSTGMATSGLAGFFFCPYAKKRCKKAHCPDNKRVLPLLTQMCHQRTT
jgi:hypothetical protein